MVPFLANNSPGGCYDGGTFLSADSYFMPDSQENNTQSSFENLPQPEGKLQRKRKMNCAASAKSRRKKKEKIKTLGNRVQNRAWEKKMLEAEIEEAKKKFEETEILRKKIEDILRFQKIPFDLDN